MSKLATTGVLAQLKQANVMTLSATGDGTGVSTLRFGVSSQITVTLNANAHFYTEPTGMDGESQTWTVTSGALRTIYLKCTSGTATLTITDASKINYFGDSSGQGNGWLSSTNAAQLTFDVSKLINLSNLRIEGNSVISGALPTGLTNLYLIGNLIYWTYSGALPTGLTDLYLIGNLINWTYSGALPTGLTGLYLYGNLINWTYSGALPTGLTILYLIGNLINWTYSGALPTGLTFLCLNGNLINWTYSGALPTGLTNLYLIGNSINWTYSGALPTGLTILYLNGNLINWTYSGALPTGLTFLYLNGNLINWTYNAIEGTANFTYFELINYRSSKMSSDDMVTLLDSIRMRDGRCCSSITINDYEDYTDPPQKVKDAKLALIAADKGVTTINLGE